MSYSGLKAKFSLPHRRNRDKADVTESIQPSWASLPHVTYADTDADLHSSSSSTDKTSQNQPAAGGVSPSLPPQISDNKLDVICIPCNNNYTVSMSRKAMSLSSSLGMDDRSMSEKSLKRIPYMPKESFAFIWSRRSLLSLSDRYQKDIERNWQADYMMYVCLDEDAGLARNKYLELISGLQVYGDAFLFKVKRGGLAKLERAEYVNMDDDFGRDSRSLLNSNIILRKFLDPELQDGVSMYFESKLAPELYADPPCRRPYMKSLTSVDAVRLSCDPSALNPICLVNIPLVGLDTFAKIHKEVETRLRQVPDLSSYEGQKNFD